MERSVTENQLSSASEVIDALGGTVAVARFCGRSKQSVSMWRANKRLPANTYKRLSDALRDRNLSAPDSLWSQL